MTDDPSRAVLDEPRPAVVVVLPGYNVIRLPFSDDVVQHPVVPSAVGFWGQDGPVNTDLQGLDSLGVMDKIIDYAGSIGLKVNLDNHRSEAGNSAEQNGLCTPPTTQRPRGSQTG